jgi:hypothetical protein
LGYYSFDPIIAIMGFNPTARGIVDKYIDNAIKDIPEFMSVVRMKEVKERFLFNSEEDFVYGVVYGRIIFGLDHLFDLAFGRHMNKEESDELNLIIGNRMREVKNAIFKTG